MSTRKRTTPGPRDWDRSAELTDEAGNAWRITGGGRVTRNSVNVRTEDLAALPADSPVRHWLVERGAFYAGALVESPRMRRLRRTNGNP